MGRKKKDEKKEKKGKRFADKFHVMFMDYGYIANVTRITEPHKLETLYLYL